MGLEIDPAMLFDAVRPQLEEIAQQIAVDARRGYQQKELKTASRKSGVIVESDTDGVRVVTHNPFGHLDEWGGDKVYSRPTAAMRRAAMRHGRFIPAARP